MKLKTMFQKITSVNNNQNIKNITSFNGKSGLKSMKRYQIKLAESKPKQSTNSQLSLTDWNGNISEYLFRMYIFFPIFFNRKFSKICLMTPSLLNYSQLWELHNLGTFTR